MHRVRYACFHVQHNVNITVLYSTENSTLETSSVQKLWYFTLIVGLLNNMFIYPVMPLMSDCKEAREM